MPFLIDCKANAPADLVYCGCPMYLLEPMELLKALEPGQGLEILSDEEGALGDMSAWCAIGNKPEVGLGSVVFTLNCDHREEEAVYVISHLPPAAENLHSFSAVRRQKMAGGCGSSKMKLSTRSRYGARLMLELAAHYHQGPLHLDAIALQQGISVKYLEQIIIPLKKAKYIQRVRGPKGGHILAKPPAEITVGEIVALLEDGPSLTECSDNPQVCDRSPNCVMCAYFWQAAAQAMFDKLQSITLADL